MKYSSDIFRPLTAKQEYRNSESLGEHQALCAAQKIREEGSYRIGVAKSGHRKPELPKHFGLNIFIKGIFRNFRHTFIVLLHLHRCKCSKITKSNI